MKPALLRSLEKWKIPNRGTKTKVLLQPFTPRGWAAPERGTKEHVSWKRRNLLAAGLIGADWIYWRGQKERETMMQRRSHELDDCRPTEGTWNLVRTLTNTPKNAQESCETEAGNGRVGVHCFTWICVSHASKVMNDRSRNRSARPVSFYFNYCMSLEG